MFVSSNPSGKAYLVLLAAHTPGLHVTRTASVRIVGGRGAASAARAAIRSLLEGRMDPQRLGDAALAVSELVVNSVRHADMQGDAGIGLEILVFGDRLRLCVVDSGATQTPHIISRLSDEPGGLGLVIVDRLALAWGVARDGTGVTRTWCDLPLVAFPGHG